MGNKIDLPGTGASVDPTDPTGAVRTLAMTAVGFMLTAGVASVGVNLWNRASQTTDRFDEINLV